MLVRLDAVLYAENGIQQFPHFASIFAAFCNAALTLDYATKRIPRCTQKIHHWWHQNSTGALHAQERFNKLHKLLDGNLENHFKSLK